MPHLILTSFGGRRCGCLLIRPFFPPKPQPPQFVAQVHISSTPRDTLHPVRSFLDSVRYATPPDLGQRGGDDDLGGATSAHEAEEKTGGQFWFLGWK